MSAPPGWHLQPDGRERWWDGAQWTDQFRTPLPADPTAPPPPPSWASNEPTQTIGLEPTQAIPAADHGPDAAPATSAGHPGVGAAPTAPQPAVPPPYGQQPVPPYGAPGEAWPPAGPGGPATGYGGPAPGYGAPGQPWTPPQQQRNRSGCLIAVVVTLLVLAVLGGLVVWAVVRVGQEVSDAIESATSIPSDIPGLPTDLPSGLPTDLPSDLPSVAPTTVEVGLGEGFDLGRARVDDGWTVRAADGVGARVDGMRVTFDEPSRVPAVFSMSFRKPDGDALETVCTSDVGSDPVTEAGVTCVPIFGDITGVDRVTVTSTF